MAITIEDVAREAGVSIATVSRVMNGTKPVSPELIKERVLKVIQREQLPPQHAGPRADHQQDEHHRRHRLRHQSNPVFGALTKGVNRVCQARGTARSSSANRTAGRKRN